MGTASPGGRCRAQPHYPRQSLCCGCHIRQQRRAVGTVVLHWGGTVWQQVRRPGGGSLSGVAATSAGNVWAVGFPGDNKTLILHWTGVAWARLPSPSPDVGEGLTDILDSVAVTPTGSAWAVGDISCGCGPGESLIERWNGRMWVRVPGPPQMAEQSFATWSP